MFKGMLEGKFWSERQRRTEMLAFAQAMRVRAEELDQVPDYLAGLNRRKSPAEAMVTASGQVC
jgi:hypothetical protein